MKLPKNRRLFLWALVPIAILGFVRYVGNTMTHGARRGFVENLEAYRARYGEWPANLAEMEARMIPHQREWFHSYALRCGFDFRVLGDPKAEAVTVAIGTRSFLFSHWERHDLSAPAYERGWHERSDTLFPPARARNP